MVPFQCKICHVRNLLGRDPRPSEEHEKLMRFIRHCNLDAMWSWEPATVAANLGEARRLRGTAADLGLESLVSPMGPFLLKDSLGLHAGLAVLHRAQDKTGKHEARVLSNTCQRTQSTLANVTRAGVGGLGAQAGTLELGQGWAPQLETHPFCIRDSRSASGRGQARSSDGTGQ